MLGRQETRHFKKGQKKKSLSTNRKHMDANIVQKALCEWQVKCTWKSSTESSATLSMMTFLQPTASGKRQYIQFGNLTKHPLRGHFSVPLQFSFFAS